MTIKSYRTIWPQSRLHPSHIAHSAGMDIEVVRIKRTVLWRLPAHLTIRFSAWRFPTKLVATHALIWAAAEMDGHVAILSDERPDNWEGAATIRAGM